MFFNKQYSISKKDRIKRRLIKTFKSKILQEEFNDIKNKTIYQDTHTIKSNKERCDERNTIKYADTK